MTAATEDGESEGMKQEDYLSPSFAVSFPVRCFRRPRLLIADVFSASSLQGVNLLFFHPCVFTALFLGSQPRSRITTLLLEF